MKKILNVFIGFLFLTSAVVSLASVPVVIFDTDMGNDIDDALAQAMLLNYQKNGKIKIAAMCTNKDNSYSPAFVHAINEYYGFADIPLGVVINGATKSEGCYIGKVCRERNIDMNKTANLPEATKLLRKTLAAANDGEIIYISVGFSTNVVRLLESSADEFSPLNGRELVAKKVKYFSVMAGEFDLTKKNPSNPYCEYNVKCDIPTAKIFFENSPVPIVFSGFEIGRIIKFPAKNVYEDLKSDNPIIRAYELYSLMVQKGKTKMNDRETWDLTSVLYVVEPNAFSISEYGDIKVSDKGATFFTPNKNGKLRYLKLDATHTIDSVLDRLLKLALDK